MDHDNHMLTPQDSGRHQSAVGSIRTMIAILRGRHLLAATVLACGGLLSVGMALIPAEHSPASASTPSIYLVEGEAGRIDAGQEVTWGVRISPGREIDTVVAELRFDPDKLDYRTVSYDGSPFGTQIPAIVSDGAIKVQATSLGGRHGGDALVATLTFVAKTDHNPSVSLAAGNAAVAGVAIRPRLVGQSPATVGTATDQSPSCSDDDTACQQAAAPGPEGDDASLDTEEATSASAAPKNPGITGDVESVLRSSGVSDRAAAAVAPWATAALVTAVIGGIAAVIVHYARKHPDAWRKLFVRKKEAHV